MRKTFFMALMGLMAAFPVLAQVNSGSNGSDGEFHPTVSTNINMADHPDGIYHYTSVTIPVGVEVTFTPNANNTPVVWLVQSNCSIYGAIKLMGGGGGDVSNPVGGTGGPGGFSGGRGGSIAGTGQGPGSGATGFPEGRNASYATKGHSYNPDLDPSGSTYGNKFIVPLLGGSGGGGSSGECFGEQRGGAGGGGGGAVLVACSGTVRIDGSIHAYGGPGSFVNCGLGALNFGGAGSGGAVRFVAEKVMGNGWIHVLGGSRDCCSSKGGDGWIRFDTFDNLFAGSLLGEFSHGFQPIIIPSSGQSVQLAIASVAGNIVPANASSLPANPAIIIPAQQANPIPIVVRCSNVPLNTPITVVVKPANGPAVSATANNTTGTTTSSTATVNLNMPRGGGVIYATTVVGIAGQQASLLDTGKTARTAFAPRLGPQGNIAPEKAGRLLAGDDAAGHSPALRDLPLSVTGWTAGGERFAQMEITAALDGKQEVIYITESGKRYPLAAK